MPNKYDDFRTLRLTHAEAQSINIDITLGAVSSKGLRIAAVTNYFVDVDGNVNAWIETVYSIKVWLIPISSGADKRIRNAVVEKINHLLRGI